MIGELAFDFHGEENISLNHSLKIGYRAQRTGTGVIPTGKPTGHHDKSTFTSSTENQEKVGNYLHKKRKGFRSGLKYQSSIILPSFILIVCVCIYIYTHTYTCVCVCVYICIYIHIYIHTHIHVYVCVLLSSHVFSSHIYYIFIQYTLINGNSVLTLGIYGYNLISITKKFPRYTPLIKCLSYSSYSFRDNINFIIHMNTIADCKMASYSTLVSVKTANPRIISMIVRLSGCQPRAVHTGNKDTTAMAACK